MQLSLTLIIKITISQLMKHVPGPGFQQVELLLEKI